MPPPGWLGTRFRNSSRRATSTPGVPGPPMNLWGLMNTASLYASGSSAGSISMFTYGAAAAKSKNDRAPCSWRRREIANVLLTIPVTFEAAENEPIFSGRSA